MLLRNLLHDCGPWPEGADPEAIADALRPVWRGARVFMTRPAAKRVWRRERREPRGAAERLAHDVEAAIGARGRQLRPRRAVPGRVHELVPRSLEIMRIGGGVISPSSGERSSSWPGEPSPSSISSNPTGYSSPRIAAKVIPEADILSFGRADEIGPGVPLKRRVEAPGQCARVLRVCVEDRTKAPVPFNGKLQRTGCRFRGSCDACTARAPGRRRFARHVQYRFPYPCADWRLSLAASLLPCKQRQPTFSPLPLR